MPLAISAAIWAAASWASSALLRFFRRSSAGGGGGGVHLLGDSIALAAALCWGLYCVFVVNTEGLGYTALQMTRKILFWGVLLCLPFALLLGDVTTARAFATEGARI